MGLSAQADDDQSLTLRESGPVDIVAQIEEMWLLGRSQAQMYLWGVEHHIDGEQIDHIIKALKKLRRAERDSKYFLARQEEQRERYLLLFRQALEEKDISLALRILDSMSKFEGFMLPEMSLTQVQFGAGNNGLAAQEITNKTRERLQSLMTRVQERSGARGSAVLQAKNANGTSNGHTNGHSTKIIDVEKPDGDDE